MIYFSKKGFTLIEVILSIGIVAITLFGLLALFPFSLRLNHASANLTQATYLAQAGIEQALSIPYNDLGSGTIEAKAKLSSNPDNILYYFERDITVDYLDQNLNVSGVDLGLKKITTTVYWYNPLDSNEQTYSLSTLITDY